MAGVLEENTRLEEEEVEAGTASRLCKRLSTPLSWRSLFRDAFVILLNEEQAIIYSILIFCQPPVV